LHSSGSLTHEDFEKAYQYFHHDRPAIAGTIRQLEMFLDQTQGLSPPMPSHKTHTDCELDRFTGYLESVRGLKDNTIQHHCKYIKRFLDYIEFETIKSSLSNLTLRMIEGFIEKCSETHNRYSLQHVVGYLRSFLRFLYSIGALTRIFHPQRRP